MGWVAVVLKLGSSLLKSVKENPKTLRLLLEVGGLIWIVVCCLTHCGSRSGGNVGSSDTVTVTETIVEVDSTWYKSLGDTIAYYEAELEQRKWKSPESEVVYSDADDCNDSLDIAVKLLDTYDELLTDCDSKYRKNYRFRQYLDTVFVPGQYKFIYDIGVMGRFSQAPVFDIQILRPDSLIRETITITNYVGPYRKIWAGVGVGTRLDWGNNFNAVPLSASLGYSDLKNNYFGLRGEFWTQDYAVLFEYKRGFNLFSKGNK